MEEVAGVLSHHSTVKYKHHILCLSGGDRDSRGRAVWRVSICLAGLTAICHVNTFQEVFLLFLF